MSWKQKLKEAEISNCGLPKSILATFSCGGKKTSVGDAVGKDSFQFWAGRLEPPPAALGSEPGDLYCGEQVCSALPLAQCEAAGAVWFGQRLCDLVVGCPTSGRTSPKAALLCS